MSIYTRKDKGDFNKKNLKIEHTYVRNLQEMLGNKLERAELGFNLKK